MTVTRHGTTVLELSIGLAVAAVVLALALHAMVSAHRTVERAGVRLAARETALIVLARVRTLLADATALAPRPGGVQIVTARGSVVLARDPRRRTLALAGHVIAGDVLAFRVAQRGAGGVHVMLTVGRPRIAGVAQPALTLHDEVHVPGLARVRIDAPLSPRLR